MSVLVCGATGRLGQALVARLEAAGRSVRVLTRRPYRAMVLFGERVPMFEWHPLSEDIPAEATAGVTAVVHLMGESLSGRPTKDKLERIRISRVTATARLGGAFAGRPVRVVAASVPYLDRRPGRDSIDESEPRGIAKSALENMAQAHEAALEALSAQGARVVIVRLGLILAAEGVLPLLARLADRPLGLGLHGALIPAIDIEDAAALLESLLDRPDLEGPLHGVAPEPLRGEDLMALLAAAAGRTPRMIVPQRLIRRSVGEFAPFLTNRSRVVPRRLAEAGAVFLHPDPKASVARILMRDQPQPTKPARTWKFWQARP